MFCTFALALTVFDIFTFEIFDLEIENQVKVKEYNIRNDAIRWQMLKSINITSGSFALAFIVFEILTVEV